MTTPRVTTNGARVRYLERWRPAVKHPERVAGLEVPLADLLDVDRIPDLVPLADLAEGTEEHTNALADHMARMLDAHSRVLAAEDAEASARRDRAAEMIALALLGVRPARIAEECKVGPMVSARAIGTSARGATG